MKLLNARINNLEANLHIEIDMERIEDRSKALSYIGIEVADALKTIPTPIEKVNQSRRSSNKKKFKKQNKKCKTSVRRTKVKLNNKTICTRNNT